MKRAAIYCRVSTDEQAEKGFSLADQEKSCREYAAQHGYTVVEPLVMREQHTGSQLTERPKLGVIRDAVERREIEAVIFLKIDRLTREQHHWSILFNEAKGHGVELASVLENIEQTTMGQITSNLLAGMAQLEREAIRDRMMRGRRSRAISGKASGSGFDLYGYKKDRERGVYEVYEPEAEIVRRIYQMVAEGATLQMVMTRLTDEGIPGMGVRMGRGSGRWNGSSLSRLLKAPRYKGEAESLITVTEHLPNGQRRILPAPADRRVKLPEGVCPPIVSPELWAEVQAAMSERATSGKAARTRNQKRPHLLRDMVRCSVCGAGMGVDTSRGVTSFRCASRGRVAGHCGAKSVRADDLTAWAWDTLSEIVSHPESVMAMLAEIADADPSAELEAEVKAARKALATVEAEQNRLISLYAKGGSAVLLAKIEQQIEQSEAQRSEAAARVDAAEAALASGKQRRVDAVSFVKMLDRVKANLRTLDFDGKRLAFEALVERVVAGKDPATWRLELAIPLESGDATGILSPTSSSRA